MEAVVSCRAHATLRKTFPEQDRRDKLLQGSAFILYLRDTPVAI